jgi:hypothetical protein
MDATAFPTSRMSVQRRKQEYGESKRQKRPRRKLRLPGIVWQEKPTITSMPR